MTLSDLERYYELRAEQCRCIEAAHTYSIAKMGGAFFKETLNMLMWKELFLWAEAMYEADELDADYIGLANANLQARGRA